MNIGYLSLINNEMKSHYYEYFLLGPVAFIPIKKLH
jgi:hypothetical protein